LQLDQLHHPSGGNQGMQKIEAVHHTPSPHCWGSNLCGLRQWVL
jgi:hypothetical protein